MSEFTDSLTKLLGSNGEHAKCLDNLPRREVEFENPLLEVIFTSWPKILPVGTHLRQFLGEKTLELELACCLWMTFGCEAVIDFVLTLDLTVCTPFDSRVEGAEFEVTGLDKAFVLSTLGRTEDFGKGVTE
ncbi:hypothetical protein Tco_0727067 [Tanacetum coccineum]|uniref:Uncharacterized protein n=1 Tax=Tanacetum coccineum TaxID=301880 RepID=A0ABQ4YIF2_9ASTR